MGGPSNTIQNQIHYGDGGNPNGAVSESEPGPGKGKNYRNHRASSPGLVAVLVVTHQF